MYFNISANKILKFFSISIIKTLEFFFLFPSIIHYHFFGNKLNKNLHHNKDLRLNYASFAKEVNIYIENNFKHIIYANITNNILKEKISCRIIIKINADNNNPLAHMAISNYWGSFFTIFFRGSY